MGLIVKTIAFAGDKGKKHLKTLFDSGASMSLIKRSIAEELAQILPTVHEYAFETAEPNRFIRSRHAVRLEFYLNNEWLSDEFIVIDDNHLSEDVIIGAKTMQAWRILLDMEKEEAYSIRKVKKHMLK